MLEIWVREYGENKEIKKYDADTVGTNYDGLICLDKDGVCYAKFDPKYYWVGIKQKYREG